MKNYCTLSDITYLKFGKALFKSLDAQCDENFILHYLCIDDETYEELIDYDSRLIPVKLDEVLSKYPNLVKYKETKAYNEFCWSLASSFSLYLLEHNKIESHLSQLMLNLMSVLFTSRMMSRDLVVFVGGIMPFFLELIQN